MNDSVKNGFLSVFDSLLSFINAALHFYSTRQTLLERIGLILSGVLAFFIVYFIIRLGIYESKKEFYIDIFGGINISKRRALRSWRQVQGRLAKKDEGQAKIAIAECDKILDELAKINGIKGRTLSDRMEQLAAKVSNFNDLMSARRVIGKFKNEPDFKMTLEEAGNIAAIYETAFKDLGLFS